MTNRYLSHGAVIASAIELPEYIEYSGDDKSDIEIIVEDDPSIPDETQGVEFTRGQCRMWWQGVGEYIIKDKAEILVRRCRTASPESLRLPLLGSAIAVAMHYRGALVLHSNSVEVNGAGISILGTKGQGKSTLTSAFVKRGHRLISDDVSTITHSSSRLSSVHRGAVHMKLWPDSISGSLGFNPENFNLVQSGSDKRSVPAHHCSVSEKPIPIRRIYSLEEGPTLQINKLTLAQAWMEILVHSFPARFGSSLLNGQASKVHFASCVELASSCEVVKLVRPKFFDTLGDIVSLVEHDVTSQ